MKDSISIHDYLYEQDQVGDWEGEEELVADRINAIFHAVWPIIPDETPVPVIDKLLNGIWDQLRGSEVLLDVDEDELIGWALAHSRQYLEEVRHPDEDAEDDDDVEDDNEEEY